MRLIGRFDVFFLLNIYKYYIAVLCFFIVIIISLINVNRFTPTLPAVIYHGNKHQRDEIRRKHMPRTVGPKFPLVITSYEIAMNDAKKCLRSYSWKYLAVDEVHKFSHLNV